MVSYEKHTLTNGLTVITHEAWDTPLAAVNLLYNVGSRNEEEQRTGFAHLFEHLMFGGTPAVPDFDGVLSRLGGESNAFTNCDYTNYYLTLPAQELATALRLEADRMAHLDISDRALQVQQQVVTEEYHQRYGGQPYGDVWLLLRPLCYKVHPYRWPTIGADIRHVSEATLEEVRSFHKRFYRPENAILAIAAPMKHDAMLRAAAEAWECGIGAGIASTASASSALAEPGQQAARMEKAQRDVPSPAVYLAWPMCDHFHPHFRACDLISDVLANGDSSRMYRRLVKEQGLLTEADACISGDAGPGLLLLSGKLRDGVTTEEAVEALRAEAYRLAQEGIDNHELQKVINKYENTFVFSQYKAADRALALCYYTWLGDTDLVNKEPAEYHRVTPALLQEAAQQVFTPRHENILYYEKL